VESTAATQLVWLLGSWTALVTGIAKLATYFDDLSSASAREQLRQWLSEPPSKRLQTLARRLPEFYDAVYTTDYFSWRCYVRSVIVAALFSAAAFLMAAAFVSRVSLQDVDSTRDVIILLQLAGSISLCVAWGALVPGYISVVVCGFGWRAYVKASSAAGRIRSVALQLLAIAGALLVSWLLPLLLLPAIVTAESGIIDAYRGVLAVCTWGAVVAPLAWFGICDLARDLVALSVRFDAVHRLVFRWVDVKAKPVRSIGMIAIVAVSAIYLVVCVPLVILL
jgi:hypothetical protein